MTRIKAHFDGKVIVPHEPVDLPPDTRLIVIVRPEREEPAVRGTVGTIREHMKGYEMSDEDATGMKSTIEAHCERIDPDPNVEFDAVPDGHKRRGRPDEVA